MSIDSRIGVSKADEIYKTYAFINLYKHTDIKEKFEQLIDHMYHLKSCVSKQTNVDLTEGDSKDYYIVLMKQVQYMVNNFKLELNGLLVKKDKVQLMMSSEDTWESFNITV